MESVFTRIFTWLLASLSIAISAPKESREWSAVTGHKLQAIALKVDNGKVSLKNASGKIFHIPLNQLIEADRKFLDHHFSLKLNNDVSDAENALDEDDGESAVDFLHPLGKTTGEITCGDFSYFLYLPKSLKKGKKYPVLYIMSPSGGNAGTANRYIQGAERNRWILAVSKQSKNGEKNSGKACAAMMNHVESNLPVDRKRLYTTGFSGGARMALWISYSRKEIAGVIPCGAGGNIGGRKKVAYGLCGSNCFNRTDMSFSFKNISHKGSMLRFFPGRHAWANGELCDDAITHLNGIFLAKNKSNYTNEYKHYTNQLVKLIENSIESKPLRAYMWCDFAIKHSFPVPSNIRALHRDLSSVESNKLYLKGLFDIRKFAEKNFGLNGVSQREISPKLSNKCLREAKKYAGTPWEDLLKKMSEHAR